MTDSTVWWYRAVHLDGPLEGPCEKADLPAGYYVVNPDARRGAGDFWHGPHDTPVKAVNYWVETGIYHGESIVAHLEPRSAT